ncbi:arylsulfatase I-like [Oratosquilla oratoria]|uniref:arylsulfatase I-like n=1 Tax=Oratosquilla oratoria TaxID=337810 RepID=UPI003F75D212
MKLWFTLCIIGVVVVVVSAASATAGKEQPNVIFILVDDLGWNDVSWHNPDVISPNLHSLLDKGIDLDQYYVQPICTPTRSALMTGFYPYKYGRQLNVISPRKPTGLSLNYTLLPEAFREFGYSTHIVGKWHLGFCDWEYTPTRRGFDTFYGLYLGAQTHFSHTRSDGYDFVDQEETAFEANGTYSTFLISERTQRIIRESKSSEKPFFIYTAFQAIHDPCEVPENYIDKYPTTMSEERRCLLAMVTALDEAVGEIVYTLKAENLYDNTIIVFSSDNGGSMENVEGNLPLRGHKTTLWEGGTRVPGFIHSPLLGDTPRVHNGLFHITDWYNTLLEAARVPGQKARNSGMFENDGFSQWMALKEGVSSPRTSFVYSMAMNHGRRLFAALRRGDFKYITGIDDTITYETGPWLFNLSVDPNETTNLADEYPDIAESMRLELEGHKKDLVPRDIPATDKAGDPENRGGVWGPGWCEAK